MRGAVKSVGCASLLAISLAAAGCGDDNPSGPDGGGGGGDCEAGGHASSDRYFPFEVGNVWRYRVTDLGNNEVSVKRAELTESMTPEGETEPVIVQVTTKTNGSTVTWNRVVGDSVRRFKQIDHDETDAIERSNVYDPSRLRLDESAGRLTVGTTWTEQFTNTEFDAAGTQTGSIQVTENWTVMGVDVACETPWGTLQCLQVHREASDSDGGSVAKDYLYARGIGKVREEGASLEELVGCVLK
jgi:hypothetical protein